MTRGEPDGKGLISLTKWFNLQTKAVEGVTKGHDNKGSFYCFDRNKVRTFFKIDKPEPENEIAIDCEKDVADFEAQREEEEGEEESEEGEEEEGEEEEGEEEEEEGDEA